MAYGMELVQGYYEIYGKPMIHEKFPEFEVRIAVGLVGEAWRNGGSIAGSGGTRKA